ncbi:uncharacterized protein LOC135842675 [Planococcus citri]|uniref:uncharacterized protein LOC135842675 n=1 Tax=Planococcus citri TaxID=170843 RepID=UPI0031F94DF0
MEVLWVSLIISMLCSRSSAINMKKDNNSIIGDFYLLDKEMQLEICNIIKESNTSAQLTSQDQVQIKRDFCDHLESLNRPEVEQNLLLMDDERSSTSISVRQEPAPESTTPSSSITEILPIDTTLPDQSNSDQECSSALCTTMENDIPPSKVASPTTDLENVSFLDENITSSSMFFLEAQTTELIASSATELSMISSNWTDQSSTELPSVLNTKGFIMNSNTPMGPDLNYGDLELNALDSLETSGIDGSNDGNEGTEVVSPNFGSDYDIMSPIMATKVIFNRPCVKCSFRKNDETTQNSSSSLISVPHSQIQMIDEFSSEFQSNSDSVGKNNLTLDETILGMNYTITDINHLNDTIKDGNHLTSLENNFRVNDTIKAKETIRGFLQEIHVLPPNIKDAFPKSSTSATYSKSKPSSSYKPLQLTPSPSLSSELESLHDFALRGSNTSESSEITYNTPSSITNDFSLGSAFPTVKSSRQYFLRSSVTTTYDPLSVTKSQIHVCGSPKSHSYPSIHSTTYPNSSTRPSCNPLKLIVDPKLPRASRRRTKILSSLGNLHSYAGFFKTDQRNNVRLFFWFFCNRKWKNIPLIVWLQGEPGHSSLHGLFQEHGPYYLEHTMEGVNMKLRQFSWTKEYSVLYLDHCVGCGFSSANENSASTHSYVNIANNIYEALSQFFRIWYEMLPNDLYLAGSYAGAKFIPVIAHTIHTRNEIGFCTRRMNLKGLIIGGPYMDSTTMVNYNDFLLANGIIDEVNHKNMIPNQYHAQELIRAGKYRDAIDFLNFHVYCLISEAGYEIYKDVRFLRDDPYSDMQNVVRSAQFKKMICLDKMNFEIKSDVLTEEIMPPMDNLLIPGLLSHYKILYYNGQFDLMAPYMLTSKALSELEWESVDEFFMTGMVKWCPTKDRNSCPKGYYRNYQNLTHVMVRNAGHSVGATNSEDLFYLLKWFVEGKFQRYGDNDDEWHENL